MNCISQDELDQIFPPDRADAFFDALYGEAGEGAYDIRVVCQGVSDNSADFAFELNKRPGKCLKCSLTYGLPAVFERHPVINLQGVAQALAKQLGWDSNFSWKASATQEISDDQHLVPFKITKA